MDHDDDVLEIWDQPPSFTINYVSKSGRPAGHLYTADFFVIHKDWAGWEEWKPENELLRKSQENPEKFYQDSDGNWRCPPGENHAAEFGLSFNVRSSKEINWILIRNYKVLRPFFESSTEEPGDLSLSATIVSFVGSEPGITFADLLKHVKGASPNTVLMLLATGKLYVDLGAAWLWDRDRVSLFKDEPTARFFNCLVTTQSKPEVRELGVDDLIPGATLLLDGVLLEVIHVGDCDITFHRKKYKDFPSLPKALVQKFINEQKVTDIKTLLSVALDRDSKAYQAARNLKTKEEMSEIIWRYQNIIRPHREGKPVNDQTLTSRTLRNLIKAYDRSELEWGNGLLGLARNIHRRGNRSDRLKLIDPRLPDFLKDFIKTQVETPVVETTTILYGAFLKECRAQNPPIPDISCKTFKKAIQKRSGPKQTEKMHGSKASYQQDEFLDADEEIDGWQSDVPIHGDYPWEYAHIDHTSMDVILRHTDKGVVMGRAWITLLIDSFSRRVLAYYITYDPPSYRSCMGVIRECVRLHQRLPESFIADGGKEFKSIYFMKLVARYKADISWRPATKPRFGAVIERFIGTLNKQFLHNLLGNTKATKNVRTLTQKVNPEKLAVWNLPLLDEHLEKYLYHEFPNRVHSGLDQTPMEAFKQGIERFGRPAPTPIKYDDNFLIETCPSTRKGTAKLLRSRGLMIAGYFYRSRKLRRQELYGQQLEVRTDPWNMAHAYAWDGQQWVVCYAPKAIYSMLKNRSEREIKLLTENKRELKRQYGRDYKNRALELADARFDRKQAEELELQRLKDRELRASATQRGRRLSPSDSGSQPKNKDLSSIDNKLRSSSLSLVKFGRAKQGGA